jgi:hypothetical protein
MVRGWGGVSVAGVRNAGVLRLRLEDDGEEQTTAGATADPFGMTTQKSLGKSTAG